MCVCVLLPQVTYAFFSASATSGAALSLANVNTLFSISAASLGLLSVASASVFATYPTGAVLQLGISAYDATGLYTNVTLTVSGLAD